jgi:hypothetical protein
MNQPIMISNNFYTLKLNQGYIAAKLSDTDRVKCFNFLNDDDSISENEILEINKKYGVDIYKASFEDVSIELTVHLTEAAIEAINSIPSSFSYQLWILDFHIENVLSGLKLIRADSDGYYSYAVFQNLEDATKGFEIFRKKLDKESSKLKEHLLKEKSELENKIELINQEVDVLKSLLKLIPD